jgi:hypothetical protein
MSACKAASASALEVKGAACCCVCAVCPFVAFKNTATVRGVAAAAEKPSAEQLPLGPLLLEPLLLLALLPAPPDRSDAEAGALLAAATAADPTVLDGGCIADARLQRGNKDASTCRTGGCSGLYILGQICGCWWWDNSPSLTLHAPPREPGQRCILVPTLCQHRCPA